MPRSFRVSLPDGAYYSAHEGENLLAAAQRARWLVRFGCRNGNCEACTATLVKGAVQYRDGRIIEAPAATILLCLCHALSDVQIALADDPQPGSIDRSLRCYAQLLQQSVVGNASVVHFALPAGRRPVLDADQIALVETDAGLLQGRIDHEQSQERELVVVFAVAFNLKAGTYYHLRYPLRADHYQENRDD